MKIILLRRLSLSAVLLLTLTHCQTAEPIPEIAGYYERDCWFSGSEARKARCGWLVVPENRSRADSRMINLPVVTFPAREPATEADPILYISGGPGSRATIGERWEIAGWLKRLDRLPPQHDLIVLGLRGTGRDKPDLSCPKLTDPRVWTGAGANPPPVDVLEKNFIEATVECRDKLLSEGFDLTAYNSRETAADIVDLRSGLGIESWNLYGISYGTRIALTLLRDHPEGLRSLILDSAFPPEAPVTVNQARDLQSVLRRLFEDCEKSEFCQENYPDLEAKFEGLLDRLEKEPVELSLGSGSFWPPMPLTVDEEIFLNIVFGALYWWSDTEMLPRTIEEASTGDFASLKKLATYYVHRASPTNTSRSVRFSFICHEEAIFITDEQRESAILGTGRLSILVENSWTQNICDHWPAGEAAPIENEPVVSDVPTLFLAGSYDPITPPDLARRAAEHLGRSHVVEFANAGHGVLFSHPCSSKVLADFLADPAARPDPPCLREVASPDFSEPREDPRRKSDLP